MDSTNVTESSSAPPGSTTLKTTQTLRSSWVAFAVGSGAFAAFNGVFAKLTTGAATDGIIERISQWLGMTRGSDFLVGLSARALFFGLNLLSNAVMWILFTRALTAGNSTTRVSVINTSSNFLVTAILGMLVFSEGLALGWWAGAALLVTGSVIIGARDDGANTGIKLRDQTEGEVVPLGGASGGGRINLANEDSFKDESDDEVGTDEQYTGKNDNDDGSK